MNVTTQTPESIIVIRDGQLDDEYYDLVYEQKRQQALAQAKRELVHHLFNSPKIVGRGVLNFFSIVAEQANH